MRRSIPDAVPMPPWIRAPGKRDLRAALVAHRLAGGSEFTHGILNSERNTLAYAGECDFAFAAADAIRTDYVAYAKGYPGHQSRCAVVGRTSTEQQRQYAVIRDIYRAANDQLIPGRGAVRRLPVRGRAFRGDRDHLQVDAGRAQRRRMVAPAGGDLTRQSGDRHGAAYRSLAHPGHVRDPRQRAGIDLGQSPTDKIFACG